MNLVKERLALIKERLESAFQPENHASLADFADFQDMWLANFARDDMDYLLMLVDALTSPKRPA